MRTYSGKARVTVKRRANFSEPLIHKLGIYDSFSF